jgi:hypothetical protein
MVKGQKRIPNFKHVTVDEVHRNSVILAIFTLRKNCKCSTLSLVSQWQRKGAPSACTFATASSACTPILRYIAGRNYANLASSDAEF